MKRYYIPKTLTTDNVAVPLLIVSGGWRKAFDNATKAKRSVPPIGRPNGRRSGICRGWVFSSTDEYEPRRIHDNYLEVNPSYLRHVVRRLGSANHAWMPMLTHHLIYSYMLVPPPDYSRLKTNHKIGAPKGKLP